MVAKPTRPLGAITRGTTAPNRLRRADRWLVASYDTLLRGAADPLVVDLGFGAVAVTTVELAARLRAVRADTEVLGLEIDAERVRAAQGLAGPGLSFAAGGFEVPTGARRPIVIRAMNVLRQYDEAAVADAWRTMTSRLAPGGVLIEGTCDEVGRLASWVALTADGPQTLTFASRLATLERPSTLAERLPKALIHRNVPGERIHALLRDADVAWDRAAGVAVFGARQRWLATVAALRDDGWPVLGTASRHRLGELTVPWSAVAPAAD